MVEKFIGTWLYNHELADNNEEVFLQNLDMSGDLRQKLIESKPRIIFSVSGDYFTSRMETGDGQILNENKFKLGQECDITLPGGRKAKGMYSITDGKLCAELKAEDLNVTTKYSSEVNGDKMTTKFEIPETGMTTIYNYTKMQ
ncbi:fatty acid-binding protein, liver-like isoform X2 [Tubulanus polymorphus]|uniref:fatty acid-binding protein, liver-like isoform X2 n=1 Tax=Tubulanus polymorphus TaxID=672921 RepID=UPI003DA22939